MLGYFLLGSELATVAAAVGVGSAAEPAGQGFSSFEGCLQLKTRK